MKELLASVNSPLFAGMTIEDRVSALTCTGYRVNTYIRDQVLVFEEDDVKHIGIVLEGYVDMIKEDHWGNKTLLLRLGKDEMFGETFACAEVQSLPVDVIAAADSILLMIDVRRIISTCCNACTFHNRIIYNLMKQTAAKNLMFHRKLEITSKRTTRDKLMTYLLMTAKEQGSSSFTIPYDRQELADYLEVDRSGLSAEIGKLRREGILTAEKNRFTLL